MRPRRAGLGGVLLGVVCLTPARASPPDAPGVAAPSPAAGDVDAQRAAWRWRRAVALADASRPVASLPLPPELWTRAQPELRDLRLVDAEGRETPYVIDRQSERETAPEWGGRLADARRESKLSSEWLVDLGAPRTFDQVALDVPAGDFAKRVRLEASGDGRDFYTLRDDAGIFEREWHGRVRHTTIDLDPPATARFLRLAIDDRRSPPIDVTGVRARGLRRLAEARWSRPAPLVFEPDPGGRKRWRLDLPAGLPVESVELSTDDATFSRTARLSEVSRRDGRREERVLGEARVFRLRLDDAALSGESLRVDVQRPGRGELLLEIDDGDSPPLRTLGARVSGTAERLLFPATPGALTLYYGNERTRAPLYDLLALGARLGFAPGLVAARLLDEVANPRYAPAPPLAFVPTAGAALDATRWRSVRRFTLAPLEDIYSLTLAADDLGRLRDDLGDLRIADAQGRQVPYIVEPGAVEARVTLVWEAERATGTGGRGRPEERLAATSRYRLTPRPTGATDGATQALPLDRLELDFREAFFSRPARVLAPSDSGAREAVLWRGTLARAALGPHGPLPTPLDGRRRPALALEIDEGDNAALTPRSAEAVVRVARVTFKAAPGDYRLLFGNDEAAAPRYDLATLGAEVLAYSALPVAPGAAEDNPAFRRRAGDYFRSAPPTLLMWGTLVAAVAGLLLLTVRVLRKAEDGGERAP